MAAVILLIVFFLAMEMLVRIGARQPGGDALIRAEADRQACVLEFTSGELTPGEYLRECDWGTITVTVRPYEPFPALFEITFASVIRTGNRTTHYRVLAPGER